MKSIESVRLVPIDGRAVEVFYGWKAAEDEPERHSCRPIPPLPPLEAYKEDFRRKLGDPSQVHRAVRDREGVLVGRVFGFDLNPRNRSMEIGYYLPAECRGKGIGTAMVGAFVDLLFREENLRLNKVYATAAECNVASRRLLESFFFSLDGRNREHYLIAGERYDQYVYSLLRAEWRPDSR